MSKKENLFLPILWGVGILAMLIIGICVYLNSSDCFGLPGEKPTCMTGWEALSLQWPSFWQWIIGCSAVAIVLIIVAIYNETGAGWLGRKLRGSIGLTWALIIVAALLLFGPWGRACTDKQNAGITAPGHKVEQKVPAP